MTWDRETIVEDTAFVWAAFRESDPTFALARATCRNEAPPSLYEITQQRRRWAAGNLQAASMLPARYELLTRVRNYAWALSPVVTLVAMPLALLGVSVAYGGCSCYSRWGWPAPPRSGSSAERPTTAGAR